MHRLVEDVRRLRAEEGEFNKIAAIMERGQSGRKGGLEIVPGGKSSGRYITREDQAVRASTDELTRTLEPLLTFLEKRLQFPTKPPRIMRHPDFHWLLCIPLAAAHEEAVDDMQHLGWTCGELREAGVHIGLDMDNDEQVRLTVSQTDLRQHGAEQIAQELAARLPWWTAEDKDN